MRVIIFSYSVEDKPFSFYIKFHFKAVLDNGGILV